MKVRNYRKGEEGKPCNQKGRKVEIELFQKTNYFNRKKAHSIRQDEKRERRRVKTNQKGKSSENEKMEKPTNKRKNKSGKEGKIRQKGRKYSM